MNLSLVENTWNNLGASKGANFIIEWRGKIGHAIHENQNQYLLTINFKKLRYFA